MAVTYDIDKDIIQTREEFHTQREHELNDEKINAFKYFSSLTREIIEQKMKDHANYIKQLINNPIDGYLNLRNRLRKFGSNVSFPEFEGIIYYLIKGLFEPELLVYVKTNIAIKIQFDQTLIKIQSLLYKSRDFLPYRKTIETIVESLFFFDTIQRIKYKINNPYFHTFRYYYYLNFLLNLAPDEIVMPTFYPLGATDLLKTRAVPIWYCGLSTDMLFVDEYENTSVEFFIHDIQHCRRMHYFNELYYDKYFKFKNRKESVSPYDFLDKETMYIEFNETIKKLLLLIKHKNEDGSDKTIDEKHTASLIKMILFEIIHEAALIPDKNVIIELLLKGVNKTPVEKVIFTYEGIDIENDIYLDPTILSNVAYKLQSSFYDTADDRKEYVVPVDGRQSSKIADAANVLINFLNGTTINYKEKLLKLACLPYNKPETPTSFSIKDDSCIPYIEELRSNNLIPNDDKIRQIPPPPPIGHIGVYKQTDDKDTFQLGGSDIFNKLYDKNYTKN